MLLKMSEDQLAPRVLKVWYSVNTGEYWLEDESGQRAICGAVPRDGLPSTSEWLSNAPQNEFEQAVYLKVLRHNLPHAS